MEDSHPRTGKRCENKYRFKKSTNLCHHVLQTTPIASHNSRSYPRKGKRCKPTYRQNKTRRLCVSKLFIPSPVSYESYERLGKRCKKSFRHHKPTGLCVYTTKKRKKHVIKKVPLTIEQQEEMVASPDNFQSPLTSPEDVMYSPDNFESPNSPEEVIYSPNPETPKKDSDLF